MSYPSFDADLFDEVLTRRVIAWAIDVCLIAILAWIAWLLVVLLGIITFGLGFILLAALPAFGFFYHVLFVAGPGSATPGERMLDLTVRRDADLGPPTFLQAVIFTAILWVQLSFAFFLLLIAPFTDGKRALHDIAAGLVVVRNRALTLRPRSWNMGVR
jgi:uncharacterized RDD family membrane protein YckC